MTHGPKDGRPSALALVPARSSDPAQFAEFRRRLLAQAPVGVEVQLLDVDPTSAERIVAEARGTADP